MNISKNPEPATVAKAKLMYVDKKKGMTYGGLVKKYKLSRSYIVGLVMFYRRTVKEEKV